MTEISVVIPCYNARPFIEQALSSVLSQSRIPDEVIVVDDASTDGSAEIAERIGVRVIRSSIHRGIAAARNVGLRSARGELVAWLDADDYWEADHLQTVAALLYRFPEAVLAFSLVRMFGAQDGVWPAWLPAEVPVKAMADCLKRCVLPQNAVIVRRQQVLSAGGYDERLRVGEDYDLWLRLSGEYPFVCTHKITCNWRRHGAQSSGRIEQYWAAEYEARRRYRDVAASREAPKVVADLEAAARLVWQEHLYSAWHSRQLRHYDFHLSMAHVVPGAVALSAKYQRRRPLLLVAKAWDASPETLRAIIRGIYRTIAERPRTRNSQ